MNFITDDQKIKLLHNGHEDNADQDHPPVVKLFVPGTNCVWLLNEIMPHEPDIAFGLCDLGMGFPELGYLSLSELASINIRQITVKQDKRFTPEYPMSVYAKAARMLNYITEDSDLLRHAKATLKPR